MAVQNQIDSAIQDSEELKLWHRHIHSGDELARKRLINLYLPLAERIAKIHHAKALSQNIEFDDYLQYANIGLIEAIDKYDINRTVIFSTFAIYRIKGSIINGLDKFSERRQMYAFVRRNRLERAAMLIADDNQPTEKKSGLSLFTHLQNLVTTMAIGYLLEQPDEQNHLLTATSNYISHPEMDNLRAQLVNFVDLLPAKEKLVINLHYYQGESFHDIAEIMELTPSRVSQLHKNALLAIRKVYSGQQGFETNA